MTSSDAKVRLFRYATGKTRRTYDEGVDALHELQRGGDEAYPSLTPTPTLTLTLTLTLILTLTLTLTLRHRCRYSSTGL